MPSQSNVTEGKKTASRLLAREITLTTADGRQHTVRLLKQTDVSCAEKS